MRILKQNIALYCRDMKSFFNSDGNDGISLPPADKSGAITPKLVNDSTPWQLFPSNRGVSNIYENWSMSATYEMSLHQQHLYESINNNIYMSLLTATSNMST